MRRFKLTKLALACFAVAFLVVLLVQVSCEKLAVAEITPTEPLLCNKER